MVRRLKKALLVSLYVFSRWLLAALSKYCFRCREVDVNSLRPFFRRFGPSTAFEPGRRTVYRNSARNACDRRLRHAAAQWREVLRETAFDVLVDGEFLARLRDQ